MTSGVEDVFRLRASCDPLFGLWDSQQVEEYSYLAQAVTSGARAAEERDLSREILFIDEEE